MEKLITQINIAHDTNYRIGKGICVNGFISLAFLAARNASLLCCGNDGDTWISLVNFSKGTICF